MRTTMKKMILASLLLSAVLLAAGAVYAAPLYFPHVAANFPWQTEIAIINTGDQTITGTLRGLSDAGQLIETKAVTLSARGRRQIIVANEFTNPSDIGYIIFDTNSNAVQGYTKLYQAGSHRAAIPAVKEVNTSDIYIPHIAATTDWWTVVTLLNTTSTTKELIITFNNGQSFPYPLKANEHKVFDIAKEFFNNQPRPDIQSAVISHATGIIGIELFGSKGWGPQLEGILLTNKTTSTIYYPHVASDDYWWTGIVAYNPSEAECTIFITPFSAQGTLLSPSTLFGASIAGKGKYIGAFADLALPAETAWFKIDSTTPISGFELFGTTDGNQLAAYAESGGTGVKAGVFPKIEKNGWTGIAFVNTEDSAASVTLTAYNDAGALVATQVLPVPGHAKVVNTPQPIFSQDISSATYITYSSDKSVIGFQLNASSDGMMLDVLPGLSGDGNNPAIYGPSANTQVQVSVNGVVQDQTSGMTFAFPNGGNGTITTANATSVANPPYPGGTAFQFTYSANDAVTLRMDDKSQTNTSMYVWGDFDSKGYKWYPASPRTQSNGYLYFDLYMPSSTSTSSEALRGDTAKKTLSADVANSTLNIYVVQVTESAQQQNIRNSITTAQNAALNAMDATLAGKVRASIASNPLKYVWQTAEGCYYDGFERWLLFWRQPNPTMVIQDAAVMLTNDVLSHEIGHYLTHMIVGNTTFMSLVDAGPPEKPTHTIGLWYDQQNIRSVSLLEDYAHYLQFVQKGYVDSKAINPKIVATNFFKYFPPTLASDYNGPARSYDPTLVDIPSLEGFATVLMAYCTHSDPNDITDFKGNKATCPAVGARPGELLNVYQDGNIYINGLLNSLRNFVESKGKKNAMTVIAERLGWSYHGEGKVLISGTTTPVPNVEVINVVTVNGTEYEASRGTSNEFGTYKLDRVFPGTSQLKYMTASGLKTEDITIREDQTPTQSVGLNVIKISASPPTVSLEPSSFTGVEASNPGTTFYVKFNPERDDFYNIGCLWYDDGIIQNDLAYGDYYMSFWTAFPAGSHTLSVKCYDRSNNLLGTAEANIYIQPKPK